MKPLVLPLLALICLATPVDSAARRAGPRTAYEKPYLSVQEHYSKGLEAIESQDWPEVATQMTFVVNNFPDSPFYSDAIFCKGVAMFALGEFEAANNLFSSYLEGESTPVHFEEVFEYKYEIAEHFCNGYRTRLFGWDRGPRWGSGKEAACEIYDEIYTTLPSHELAAKSLYGKGKALQAMGEYTEAIERFQALIFRFPKSRLAAEGFLAISDAYLEQSRSQSHSPDLLPLAQINLRKFRDAYPTDERLLVAEAQMEQMQENFASGLYKTGQYFEKVKKPEAAVVYYRTTLSSYPESASAEKAREKLDQLGSL